MRTTIAMALLFAAGWAKPSLAAVPGPPEGPVVVKVNGVPVKQADVAERTLRQYGTAVLNQMVDEILVAQEAASLKVKADAKEVEARLKRISAQFPDKKAFEAQLAATGSSPEALRRQTEEQLLRETLVIKAKKLAVTDAEVKGFFDANRDKLGSPQAARLRHILVPTEKEAADLLVAVKAGADFSKLATQVSLDGGSKDKGGDIGMVAKGMLQPDIEKAVFSLKAGETTPVVKTSAGFHLFKVEEIRPAKPAELAALKGELKGALLADKVTKAWPDYMASLRQKAKIEGARQP